LASSIVRTAAEGGLWRVRLGVVGGNRSSFGARSWSWRSTEMGNHFLSFTVLGIERTVKVEVSHWGNNQN